MWPDWFVLRCVYLLRHALPALIVGALVRPRGRRQAQAGAPRILVTRLDGIGDFVLMSPFLRELRRKYPDSRITLLVRENLVLFAKACPYVSNVMAMVPEPKKEAFSSYPKYLLAFARHMKNLVALADRSLLGEMDIAIQPRWDFDMHWATLITFLSGAPRRIGYSAKTSPLKAWCNFGHRHF